MVRRNNYGMRTNKYTIAHFKAAATIQNRVSIDAAIRTYFNRAVKGSQYNPAIDKRIRSDYDFSATRFENGCGVN